MNTPLITGADYTSGLVRVGNPTPPPVAVMWRSQKSSGAYRYLRLLKTVFSVPDITSQTKGEHGFFPDSVGVRENAPVCLTAWDLSLWTTTIPIWTRL